MVRLVIDTDPGVDDAHALMIAAAYPEARIEAITTVAGNVSLKRTTANACTILDAMNVEAPVFAGCASALLGPMPDASHVHGQDGLGDCGLPASRRTVESVHAAQALIRLADEYPGELTLVAIGPLTNVALATRLDPELPGKYLRLVTMGGAVRALGNTSNPSAEFNVFTDPEAAQIVYAAWPGLTLVPWETVVEHGFGPDQVEELLAIESPRADFFRRISEKTFRFIQERLGTLQLYSADGLAVVAAIEPEIVELAEHRAVRVELSGGHTRGQTTVDWYGLTGAEPNVEIVLGVNPQRWWELSRAALE